MSSTRPGPPSSGIAKSSKKYFVAVVAILLLAAILLIFRGKLEPQDLADADENRSVVSDAHTPQAPGTRLSPRATKTAAALEADRQIREGTASAASLRRSGTYQAVSFGEDVPAFEGQAFEAFIEAANGRYRLAPNQAGNFPRTFVDPSEPVSVSLSCPDASVGDQVIINVLDGGALEDGEKYATRQVGRGRMVQVRFTPTSNQGTHRILFRHGDDTCIADIWVGADNTYHNLSKTD